MLSRDGDGDGDGDSGWWVVVGRVKSGGRWDGRDGMGYGMGWDGLLH